MTHIAQLHGSGGGALAHCRSDPAPKYAESHEAPQTPYRTIPNSTVRGGFKARVGLRGGRQPRSSHRIHSRRSLRPRVGGPQRLEQRLTPQLGSPPPRSPIVASRPSSSPAGDPALCARRAWMAGSARGRSILPTELHLLPERLELRALVLGQLAVLRRLERRRSFARLRSIAALSVQDSLQAVCEQSAKSAQYHYQTTPVACMTPSENAARVMDSIVGRSPNICVTAHRAACIASGEMQPPCDPCVIVPGAARCLLSTVCRGALSSDQRHQRQVSPRPEVPRGRAEGMEPHRSSKPCQSH